MAVRSVVLVLAMLALAACGTSVRTQVTAFNELPQAAWAGRSVAVLPAEDAAGAGLAFERYRAGIETRLAAQGLLVASEPTVAEWIARFDVDIDDGRDREVTRQVPIFGFEDAYGFGPFPGYANRCFEHPCYGPRSRYGVVGYETRVETLREYTRTLTLGIVEAGDEGRPLYEGKAVSVGTCGALAAVFDAMADALFEDWPGGDGEVRTVEVRIDLDC